MKARQLSAPLGVRVAKINWALYVATILLVLTVASIVGDLIVWSGQRFLPPPVSFIRGQSVFIAEMFYAVSYAAMGWLLATRLPRNVLGWIFLILGLSMGLQLGVTFLVQEAHQVLRPLNPWLLDAAWLVSSIHLLMIVVLTTIVFIRFPTGKPLTPRWRWAGWLTFFGALGVAIGIGLQPEGLAWYPSLPNPFGAPIAYKPVLDIITATGLVVMVFGATLATISMVLRYRRSSQRGAGAAALDRRGGRRPGPRRHPVRGRALRPPGRLQPGPAAAVDRPRRRLLPADRRGGGDPAASAVRHRPHPPARVRIHPVDRHPRRPVRGRRGALPAHLRGSDRRHVGCRDRVRDAGARRDVHAGPQLAADVRGQALQAGESRPRRRTR